MREYHKIQTVFKRDPKTNHKTLLEGEYSMPELEYLKDNQWVFTEKIDGTNIRVKWQGEKLSFGGKTDNAPIPTFLYDKLNELFTPEKMDRQFGDADVCLYGEGFGAKIQKGGGNYIQKGVSFILFDVLIDRWWLRRHDVEIISRDLDIAIVSVVGVGKLDKAIEIARNGFNSSFGKFTAEGLVMRPLVELQTRSGQRIITKIKHKDFK